MNGCCVCRILELEKGKTNVEIWDVSGDQVCVHKALFRLHKRMLLLFAD